MNSALKWDNMANEYKVHFFIQCHSVDLFFPHASQIGTFLVLNGQMNWHDIILIFRFILISKRGCDFLGGRRSSWIGAVLVLNGQMNWHIILIFRFILITKRGYQSKLGKMPSCKWQCLWSGLTYSLWGGSISRPHPLVDRASAC